MQEPMNDKQVQSVREVPDTTAYRFENPHSDERTRRMFARPVTLVRKYPKVGRNDMCPCGSGKKFKKCCLLLKPVQNGASDE